MPRLRPRQNAWSDAQRLNGQRARRARPAAAEGARRTCGWTRRVSAPVCDGWRRDGQPRDQCRGFRTEDEQQHHGAGRAGGEQAADDGRVVCQVASQCEPGDRHEEDRRDAEQAIHQDRRDRVAGVDVKPREPVTADDVAADAGRQEGPDKRADEEHAQQRPIGGRRSDSIVQSRATHRYAISARSTRTSRTATPIHRQSTPAAAAATADGSLRQRM